MGCRSQTSLCVGILVLILSASFCGGMIKSTRCALLFGPLPLDPLLALSTSTKKYLNIRSVYVQLIIFICAYIYFVVLVFFEN